MTRNGRIMLAAGVGLILLACSFMMGAVASGIGGGRGVTVAPVQVLPSVPAAPGVPGTPGVTVVPCGQAGPQYWYGGYRNDHSWGIGSFFGFLFKVALVIGLIFLLSRLFFRGRWGGPGAWRDRAHLTFEDWHREAHERGNGGPTTTTQ